jgi:general secretion pathway protein G
MKKKDFKKGFTLIELMLVIIIITTLAAIVFPRFVGRAQQARIAAAKADISNNLAVALDFYEMDNGFYPSTEQGLEALREKPTSAPTPQNWKGPYIKKKPVDPWGNPYVYVSPGIHNEDYDLYSLGPDGIEGGDDDITNWQE